MDGTSLTPKKEMLKALQGLLNEAFAEGEIDWEKLKATLGEEKNFDNTENIFIKGESLEVQKVLKSDNDLYIIINKFPSSGGVPVGRGGLNSSGGVPVGRGGLNSSGGVPVVRGGLNSSGGVPVGRGGLSSSGWVSVGRGGLNSSEEVTVGRGGRNSKNYFELPFNPALKQRAKELRQARNLSEVLFWNQVKNKQFKGFDFDRQKIVGNYIVDFYCGNCNVVIEIDGSSHDDKVEYDAVRDSYLQSLGLTVIHIPVVNVMKNMNGLMNMLLNHPALKGTPPGEGNFSPNNYIINNGELILLLETVSQTIIEQVIAQNLMKVIALDKLFKGNDQLKTNTVLQMNYAGIKFKTV